ncbi:multidrug DMT transporter permease [Legionella norrlandica]|uniref:Multidrug DMT transporter permease n=1 Tax=Legionella norrlandica TaxID=1498499 RepID=A0A0A2SSR5_9GAMM|nr:multidrug DMT transporter permease [Legionella norrlandica]KGP64175.1 multidrug DMT transporter permease [Legionella norrlandica]
MIIEKLLGNQSVIIALDIDNFLFDRLDHISDSGFDLVEINSTDANLLAKIKDQYPTLKIGASGIIDTQQLEQCYQAGVLFASSPGFLPPVAQTASVYSMCYFPGVATLSEAMAAIHLGFQQVRPCPANQVFCNMLNKYLPKLSLFPTEIEWNEAEHYLNIPTVAAVVIHNPDKKQLNALANLAHSII